MRFGRRQLVAALALAMSAALLAYWLGGLSLFERKQNMTSPPVSLQLGMLADDFSRALGHERRINKQPAGLNFHKRRWSPRAPGEVQFIHGSYTFKIDGVLSVSGTEDVERPTFGIESMEVYVGIPPTKTVPHDEARLKTMTFIQQLMQIGWKPYYYPSEARLKGKSSWADSNDRDPRYTPTFAEWMDTSNHSWKFEVNGIYLDLNVRRSFETPDPLKPGAYLMTLSLETELHKVRLWFPEDKRDNWKAHWAEMVRTDREERLPKENAARAKGLEIDTDYKDPRILAVDGPVFTAKVGEPCPKAGWWEASLPPSHEAAAFLAKAPSRWRLVQAGEAMPGFGLQLDANAGAYNAFVVWTWHRPG